TSSGDMTHHWGASRDRGGAGDGCSVSVAISAVLSLRGRPALRLVSGLRRVAALVEFVAGPRAFVPARVGLPGRSRAFVPPLGGFAVVAGPAATPLVRRSLLLRRERVRLGPLRRGGDELVLHLGQAAAGRLVEDRVPGVDVDERVRDDGRRADPREPLV